MATDFDNAAPGETGEEIVAVNLRRSTALSIMQAIKNHWPLSDEALAELFDLIYRETGAIGAEGP